jgi:hypothetical protein
MSRRMPNQLHVNCRPPGLAQRWLPSMLHVRACRVRVLRWMGFGTVVLTRAYLTPKVFRFIIDQRGLDRVPLRLQLNRM